MRRRWKRRRPDQLTARTLRARIAEHEATLREHAAAEAQFWVVEEARRAAEEALSFARVLERIRDQELDGRSRILADRHNFRVFAYRDAPTDASKLSRSLLNAQGQALFDAVLSEANHRRAELERAVRQRTLENLGADYVSGKKLAPSGPPKLDHYRVQRELEQYRSALDAKLAKDAPRRQREEAFEGDEGGVRRADQGGSGERPTQSGDYRTLPILRWAIGSQQHADHIYPVSRGGMSTLGNMVFICVTCNIGKGDKTLREFILIRGLNRAEVERRLESLGKRF
jgi:5-methylcytosine-specific restriction endonuclease McrA